MSFKIEKNVPLPDDYKKTGRKVGWVEQLAKMEDGDSFFAPAISKSTLANAMTQFKKTLPEEERELYESNIIERIEGGVQGTRFWMNVYKPKSGEAEEKKNIEP